MALQSSTKSSITVLTRAVLNQSLRFKGTITGSRPQNHEFEKPCEFLGSWKPEEDPRKAQKKLALLRRDYAKQMKEVRKVYYYEMELQRQEKQLKDEAKRESIRLAKEKRRAAKAQMAQDRAVERKALEEEFRNTLLKERAAKLDYWKARLEMVDQKKQEKNELLRRQSSMWIDENDLERKILEAIVDTTPL